MKKPLLEGLDESFGERVKEAWKVANKDGQGEKKIGASRTQIHRYATHQQSPSLVPISKLSKESGFSLEWLVYGTGPKYPAENNADEAINTDFFYDIAALVENILKKKKLKPEYKTRLKLVLAIYNTEMEKAQDTGEKPALNENNVIDIMNYLLKAA